VRRVLWLPVEPIRPRLLSGLKFRSEIPRGRSFDFAKIFDAGRPLYAMECPLDELVFVHRLATGEGIEVHAAGLAEGRNRGYYSWAIPDAERAPPRDSGPRKKIRILSDDRIIFREREGKIRMYSTPWHGDAGSASPDCVPVTRIFSLAQAKLNELVDQHLSTGDCGASRAGFRSLSLARSAELCARLSRTRDTADSVSDFPFPA
jgi:hypothetical protein